MDLRAIPPAAPDTTSLNQADCPTSESAAKPAPRSTLLPSQLTVQNSKLPIYATGGRMSASFGRGLSREIIQRIAAHLSNPKHRIQFAFAHRTMLSAITPQADAATMTMWTSRVDTLEDFKDLLQKIKGISASSLWKEPLAALGGRILRLPATD